MIDGRWLPSRWTFCQSPTRLCVSCTQIKSESSNASWSRLSTAPVPPVADETVECAAGLERPASAGAVCLTVRLRRPPFSLALESWMTCVQLDFPFVDLTSDSQHTQHEDLPCDFDWEFARCGGAPGVHLRVHRQTDRRPAGRAGFARCTGKDQCW